MTTTGCVSLAECSIQKPLPPPGGRERSTAFASHQIPGSCDSYPLSPEIKVETRMAQLLVSVVSAHEFQTAWFAGVPWIDLKDPWNGSLGMPDRSVGISVIERAIALQASTPAEERCWSLALGEWHQWQCLEREEAEGPWDWLNQSWAQTFHYWKLGLAGSASKDLWKRVAQRIMETHSQPQRLILVHYADQERAGAVGFEQVLEQSVRMGARYVLIDTWLKDGSRLMDWLSLDVLKSWLKECHRSGLQLSLAGSLRKEDLPILADLGTDVLAVRGAACDNASRTAALCPSRIQELLERVPKQTVSAHASGESNGCVTVDR